jgi:hypothetical protein
MGNQQSNENRNTRKRMVCIKEPEFKESALWFRGELVRKETYESFIRFYLDNYLVYKDGNYKYIDLANCSVFNDKESVFGLDMNYIRNYNHTKTFGRDEFYDLFGATKPIMGWKDSEGNVRDSDGNTVSELSDCLGSIGEMLEQRQNMIASIEQSRYANNHAWNKQSSWDMPPGWK